MADAFNLQLQVALSVGMVLASPVWLYQLFRFVTPGLHRHERRWALIFVAFALPLFLAGVATAYFVLPNVLGALLGFTPHGVTNIISVDHYMGFLLQIMVVFGIGFVAPVVVVVLNLVGILSARRFASWWRWVLILILVFAAVATPTGDPFNMLLFATPIAALMLDRLRDLLAQRPAAGPPRGQRARGARRRRDLPARPEPGPGRRPAVRHARVLGLIPPAARGALPSRP